MSLETPVQLQNNTPNLPQGAAPLKQALIPLAVILITLLVASLSVAPQELSLAILALGVGIPGAILAWNRPELLLLVLIFLESDIVLADELLDLRVGGGGIDLRDLVLLGTVGLTFVKQLVNKTFKIPFFPIGGMLILFLAMAALSLVNSLVFENVSVNWAFNDFRILLYYTLFFAISWGIETKEQLRTLIFGLYGMANFVVVLMIAQQIIGIDNLLVPGMVRWQITPEASNVVRILPPLILLIGTLTIVTFALIFFAPTKKIRMLAIAQYGILLLGFVLTFTRSAWLTSVIATLIVLAVVANRNRQIAAYLLVLFTPLMLGVALVLTTVSASTFENYGLGGSLIARVLSIFDVEETAGSDSLQWRVYENTEAVRSISERPIFGVGLGNQYRPITIIQGEAAGHRTTDDITRLTRYIHNSFLSMAVKMGVPVLVFFLTIYGIFILKAWNLQQLLPNGMHKSIVLGVIAIFIPCLFWAQFFSLYTESNHIISIAMFMGIVGVIARVNQKEHLI